MSDVLSLEQRHRCMTSIHGKNTKPELYVRSWLHKHGFRYRLHKKELPGTPDIVLKKYNLVIFINGCYWHRHPGCKYATMPATNTEFWSKKFEENVLRDYRNTKKLEEYGWKVLIIWECEVKSGVYTTILEEYLGNQNCHNNTAAGTLDT